MIGSLGAPELIIIGVLIILIFGVGKLSGLGRDLGNSIKEFRRAVKDEDAEKQASTQQATAAPPPPPQQAQQAPPPQQQYTPPPQPPAQQPGEGQKPHIF